MNAFLFGFGASLVSLALRTVLLAGLLISSNSGCLFGSEPGSSPRHFIAHRGVNLRSTIAGENSLESIGYTKRAGFTAIETDVRLTKDGQLVIMHDATLNRTCLNADGSEIPQPTPVADRTLEELTANYVLKATEAVNRTKIPTLREFLTECRREGLQIFIHPKLEDETGQYYRDIIAMADEVLGKNNYVFTSNNKANRYLREHGIKDVPLMGILHEASFEEIERLGNAIMAISVNRFSPEDYRANVARAAAAQITVESTADKFVQLAAVKAGPVEYISTDYIAPDPDAAVPPLVQHTRWDEFNPTGSREGDALRLSPAQTLTLKTLFPKIHFGGLYLEMEVRGSYTVRLAEQEFSIEGSETTLVRHQLMVHDAAPDFRITARGDCEIKRISLKLVSF